MGLSPEPQELGTFTALKACKVGTKPAGPRSDDRKVSHDMQG